MRKIPGGYILQPRKIDESQVMREPPVVREVWLYLLRRVSHRDGDTPGMVRGSGIFKFSEIQEALSWYVGFRKMKYSKPQITKVLRRLREGNMIATAKETSGIRVTILNYDFYQDPKNYEGNDEDRMKESRRKHEGNALLKEDKNVRSEERIQASSEACGLAPTDPSSVPPKKRPKTATAIPDEFPLTDEMIAFAQRQGCNGNIQAITEAFLDYHRAKGSRFKDWAAAWRTWIRNEVKFRKPGPPVSRKTQHNLAVIQDFLSRGEQ